MKLFPELFINKIFEYTFVRFVSDQSLWGCPADTQSKNFMKKLVDSELKIGGWSLINQLDTYILLNFMN